MKKLTHAEWMLFVIPFLILPAILVAQKMRRAPQPPPTPKPTPPPRPVLLTERSSGWYSILSTPDGKKIITGSSISSSGYGVQVWDAKSLQLLFTFGAQRGMSPLALTPDGRLLVVGWGGPNEKYVLIYDVATGRQILQTPYGTGTTEFAVSLDGKTLALGQTETLDLREIKTGRLVHRMRRWLREPAASDAESPTFSPDQRRIAFVDDIQESAVAYANGKRDEIGIFSLKSGRKLRSFGWPHADIRDIAFSPDGKFLAVLAWIWTWPRRGQSKPIVVTNRVLLCDAHTGHVRRSLPTRPQMHTLAFSPDGRWLAFGSYGEGVQLWDLHSGKLHLDRRGDQPGSGGDYVHSLNFTPDSRTLLIGANKVVLFPVRPK